MKGFCFLGEPEGGKRHLKIVLSEPNRDKLVVVVTVTSLREAKWKDTSCVLREGDHPFIRHDSFVAFSKAQVVPALEILRKLHSGELVRKEELEPAVFDRVLAAAKASRRMRGKPKSMLFSAM